MLKMLLKLVVNISFVVTPSAVYPAERACVQTEHVILVTKNAAIVGQLLFSAEDVLPKKN